jgi:hypothetical protein
MRKYLVFNGEIVGYLDNERGETVFYDNYRHLSAAYTDGVLKFEVNPTEWDSKAINLIIDYSYLMKNIDETEH